MMALLLLLVMMRMKKKVPELVEQARAPGDIIGDIGLDLHDTTVKILMNSFCC